MSQFSLGEVLKMRDWKSISVLVGIVIVVAALAYAGYQLFLNQAAAGKLPAASAVITFVQSGVEENYSVGQSRKTLKRIAPKVRQSNISTYEDKPNPFKEDERIALGSVPGIKGNVLGILKADDSFEILVSGDTNKSDLVVTEGGIAVYSAQKVSVPQAVNTPPPANADTSDDGIEHKGTATGPVNTGVSFVGARDSANEAQLYAVNVKTRQIRNLGFGRSPRLLPDGSVVALFSEGVVLVNPENGHRDVLIEFQGADGVLGGISKSGTVIAVAGTDNQSADFYTLTKGEQYSLTHIGTLQKKLVATSVAFVDDTKFFVRETAQSARLFAVPTAKLPVAVPELFIRLEQ